jgi:nucleotide-binding universal stress UspA family protein
VTVARPRTIVVGYDGSAAAHQAIAEAASLLAGRRGARLLVVHGRAHTAPAATSRWRELLDAEDEAKGQAILDAILLEGHDELADLDWEARLEPGSPAEAMISVAHDAGADLIVVGSHGYGPVHALLGSVSHELLRTADVPVLVVPPGALHRRVTAEAGTADTRR